MRRKINFPQYTAPCYVSHSRSPAGQYIYIKKLYLFTPHELMNSYVGLSWGSYCSRFLMLTLPLGQIRWPLHELMCYCFVSVCAHACILVCHYQWMENLISVRFTLTSHGFPFFQRDWWHFYTKLHAYLKETMAERDGQWKTERYCLIWFAMLVCSPMFMKKNVNFRVFDNILNSVVMEAIAVNGN